MAIQKSINRVSCKLGLSYLRYSLLKRPWSLMMGGNTFLLITKKGRSTSQQKWSIWLLYMFQIVQPYHSFPPSNSRYTVELVCYVEAFPRPTITWVHEGIQLSTNQKYIVDTGFATIDSFIQTSVRIRWVSICSLKTLSVSNTFSIFQVLRQWTETKTPFWIYKENWNWRHH